MGLFGKRKEEKKAKQNQEDIINIINGTTDKKVDKKANSDKYIMANQQQAELQKEQLMEKLKDLRRECLRNNGFEDFETQIQGLISKIGNGRNISNSNIQFAVDNFIIKKIDECFNYVNRNSVLGVLTCLDGVESLIQDRNDLSSDLSKYTIKEYVQSRVQFDKYKIDKQIIQAQITQQQNQIDKLKAYGNLPEHKNEVQAIIAQIKTIKTDIDLKQKRSNNLDVLIDNLNKVLSSIERNINLQEIPGYNITETITNVASQNEFTSTHLEEVMEAGKELDSSLRDNNVSDRDLTVGDSTLTNEPQTDSYQDSIDELNSL